MFHKGKRVCIGLMNYGCVGGRRERGKRSDDSAKVQKNSELRFFFAEKGKNIIFALPKTIVEHRTELTITQQNYQKDEAICMCFDVPYGHPGNGKRARAMYGFGAVGYPADLQ